MHGEIKTPDNGPLEITSTGQTTYENGLATARDNVAIHIGNTDIYADYAQYNSSTHVVAYDPKGMKARSIKAIADAEFASSALEAVTDAEALIIATDWNEFANVDLAVLKDKMRTPIVFDGRNLLDPETMRQFGFSYYSVGRAGVRPQ